MPRVVHFEIQADDPERAAKFYTAVFGWKIEKWQGPIPYWTVMTGQAGQPGIDGGIMNRQPGPPAGSANAYLCTVDVPSVDEYVQKITSAGGGVAVPKMAVPGVGWMAYCIDTEANIFGILQEDRAAK